MMRIAICDDLPEELQNLLSMTHQYLSLHALEAEVVGFSHPDTLLTAIESERFHLYIMDIVMPMLSGLELGKEIRRFDREAQVIYATTEPQFALQAYAANPISYLVKPVVKQEFFNALTLAISKVDLADEQTFVLKITEGLQVVRLTDIACCEYRSHAALFSLTNGETRVSRSFRESFSEYCAPILKDRHFLKCHASFVVNMRRVERFTKDSFSLRGGKVVPIASTRYPEVRDAYMDYLAAGEFGR